MRVKSSKRDIRFSFVLNEGKKDSDTFEQKKEEEERKIWREVEDRKKITKDGDDNIKNQI